MAPTLLTHLSLASSSHRASIAFFFFIIITIFLVPFLSASTSELTPRTLPRFASTLWHSLLGILSSSPFYFLLLNFLIAALVFLSGALDPSSSGHEPDGLLEGDLQQRSFHDYSTAAQMLHERLAFDELYESQAPSLLYLNIAESSHVYVADDGMICNGGSDAGEVHTGKGKQIMADPIDSILHQRPAFLDVDCSNALEEGSSSGRMDATEACILTGSMVGDESDIKAKDIQVYDMNLHKENDADIDVDVNAAADADAHQMQDADVISNDQECGSDVIHDEDGSDVIHADDVDDGNVHNHECNGTDAEADRDKDRKQRRQQRIPRTPSEPVIAGTMHAEQGENVGEEGRGRCMSLERVQWWGSSMEKQKEEVMMSMSREELNERASAFISAFRKKLVSTAIDDDVSGHM